MDENSFLKEIESTFYYIENMVDSWNDKFDMVIEINRDGYVLEIEFETRKKIILNAQTPMLQLWLASELGAYHFKLENSEWIDSRGNGFFKEIFIEHACKLSETKFVI